MKGQCEKIRCSVCQEDKNIALEDIDLRLHRCGNCSHAFKFLPKEEQEKYREDYFAGTHKNWFSNPDHRYFEFIHREILKLKGKKSLRLLDVGCGNGAFLKYLVEKNSGLELYGIDLVKNQYPGINFITGDMLEKNINLKFDIICNLAVIEHVDSPRLFMKKMDESLVPGGIIFTMTINEGGVIYRIAKLLKKNGINSAYDRLYENHHLQFFSVKSLDFLIKKCGLTKIIQKKHNYYFKAVDYPVASFPVVQLYKIAVWIIFFLSSIFNNGILQTAMYKKHEQ